MTQRKHAKWKISKGENLWHKMNRPRSFRKLSKIETYAILGMLLTSFLFIIPAGVYFNDYLPNWHDPYTTLWRGNTAPRFNTTLAEYTAGTTTEYSFLWDGVFDVIGQCFQVTQSLKADFASLYLKKVGSPTGTFEYAIFPTIVTTSNVGGLCAADTSVLALGSTFSISAASISTSFSKVERQFITRPNLQVGMNYSLAIVHVTGDGWDFSNHLSIGAGDNDGYAEGNAFYCALAPSCNDSDGVDLKFEVKSWSNCPNGYNCINTVVDGYGNIILEQSLDFAPVAISNSSIAFGTAAGKSLSFPQAMVPFSDSGTGGTVIGTSIYAWFLTKNSTVPTSLTYNPLNDPSVSLVVITYTNSSSTNVKDSFVYMRREPGGSLLGRSKLPENPIGSCLDRNNVFFICSAIADNFANSQRGYVALLLNYTGSTLQQAITGQSYLCVSTNTGSGASCLAGGDDTTGSVGTIANQNITSVRDFPWLDLQEYHMGFWARAQYGATSSMGYINVTSAQGQATNKIQVIVPNVCAVTDTNGCITAETQPQGFFGWLGRTIGGAFTIAGNTLGAVFGPALNIAGSLMGAVFAAFVQVVSFLIEGYRIILNMIGNLVGLGNLGDALIGFLTTIATAVIKGFSTLLGIILLIGVFITQGYLGFVAGIVALAVILFPFLFILWQIIIGGTFTITDILFLDYVLGMFMVLRAIEEKKSSLKAFLGWIALNVFIATFVIEAINYAFTRFIDPIRKSKQTVDPVG